jgi:hypothetical protein
MQLILAFLDPTERSQNHPRSGLASKPWDQLDEASQMAALEILARLIARMVATDPEKATTND